VAHLKQIAYHECATKSKVLLETKLRLLSRSKNVQLPTFSPFCLDGQGLFLVNRSRPLFFSIVSTCFCLGHTPLFKSSFTTSSHDFLAIWERSHWDDLGTL